MMYETENAYYDENKDQFLREHHGKVLAIEGRKVLGVYESGPAAYKSVTSAHGGDKPFLIKKVEREEECVFVRHVVTIERLA